MKKIILHIVILGFLPSLLNGQCDLYSELDVNYNIENCCQTLNPRTLNLNSVDTLDLKYSYYKLLCADLSSDEFKSGFELFRNITRNCFSKEGDEKNSRFYKKNSSKLKKCNLNLLDKGYHLSVRESNYYAASYFAGQISKHYMAWNQKGERSKWRKLEIKYFQKYAKSDYFELLEFHSDFLLKDTSETLSIINEQAYEYLIGILDKQISSKQLRMLLDKSMINSVIVNHEEIMWFEVMNDVDLDLVTLQFEFEEVRFDYFNYDISMLYHKDTIVEYKSEVYHCGDNYQVEPKIVITSDTIKNAINDLADKTRYIAELKNTYLYKIIEDLNN